MQPLHQLTNELNRERLAHAESRRPARQLQALRRATRHAQRRIRHTIRHALRQSAN